MELLVAIIIAPLLIGAVSGLLFIVALHLAAYTIKFLIIVFGIVLRLMAQGLLWVLGYVVKALLWGLIQAGKGLLWVLVQAGKGFQWAMIRAGHGIRFASLLLYYLIDEKLRGTPDEEWDDTPEEEPEDPADTTASETPYEAALRILGLPPGFTKTGLRRFYLKAIKCAHPDAGGSAEQAQAINAARDLVMDWNGWA